jgi:hypothetical protein
VTFRAPAPDIDRWLQSSPGPSEATVESIGTKRRFSIRPGAGAQFAQVEVDDASSIVTIYAYWS